MLPRLLLSLTAPIDYTAVMRTLNFASGTTRVTVDIPINNDDIVESVENFFATLTLETPGANVVVDPARAEIRINDSDSELYYCWISRGNVLQNVDI